MYLYFYTCTMFIDDESNTVICICGRLAILNVQFYCKTYILHERNEKKKKQKTNQR